MYSTGLTPNLIYTALVVGLIGVLSVRRVVGTFPAVCLALLKVGICVVYFAWYFDDGWILLDDMTYFSGGAELLDRGINPFTLWFDGDLMEEVVSLVGGRHILYVVWNAFAQLVIGEYYYAPVFLNILVTFLCAPLLAYLASRATCSEKYGRWLVVFFLIHWDILAWSSFVNLKDIVVLFMTLLTFCIITALSERFTAFRLLALLICLAAFQLIRFYVPVLILSAVGVWIFLEEPGRRKALLLPITAFALWYIFPEGTDVRRHVLGEEGLFYGLVRYLLNPRPWAVLDDYSFIEIPALFHWLFFPLALVGVGSLWKLSRVTRLLIIYFCIVAVFYALLPELQGVRQRVQLVFVFAWLQYHGLLVAFAPKPNPHRATAANWSASS